MNKLSTKEIAYKIYIQLETRKIAIPFDKKNDVLIDVYNSWYTGWTEIRKLIMEIEPRDENEKLVSLCLELMNKHMRPHLTKHQARFRHWWGITYMDSSKTYIEHDPQIIQETYPNYDDLISELVKCQQGIMDIAEKLKVYFYNDSEENVIEDEPKSMVDFKMINRFMRAFFGEYVNKDDENEIIIIDCLYDDGTFGYVHNGYNVKIWKNIDEILETFIKVEDLDNGKTN